MSGHRDVDPAATLALTGFNPAPTVSDSFFFRSGQSVLAVDGTPAPKGRSSFGHELPGPPSPQTPIKMCRTLCCLQSVVGVGIGPVGAAQMFKAEISLW